MVQVDVFWSYGLGAGLAVAAGEQLRREAPPADDPKSTRVDPMASGHFARSLLYIACLFAPSGVCLLWAFPSWETMHVGDRDLPAWLVTLFAATNVSQGALGYFVARRAIREGRTLRACMHWAAAYFGMFFILVHGWDGTGYRRFFSATKAQFESWHAGRPLEFLSSDVAMTLYAMGCVLLPVLFAMSVRWTRRGHRLQGREAAGRVALVVRALIVVFGVGLGLAILASVMTHALGWWPGFLAALAFAYVVATKLVLPRVCRPWLEPRLEPDAPAPKMRP